MITYLALLRGINVGGNNIIPMADLRVCFEKMGLNNVRTFIQTGNVFFESDEKNIEKLEKHIASELNKTYSKNIALVLFTKPEWQKIIDKAPKEWGNDKSRKHNLLILLRSVTAESAINAIGQIKPDIESVAPGDGVVYQSIDLKLFGRTTSGKLAGNPIYKQMTIRNFNTATKLLDKF